MFIKLGLLLSNQHCFRGEGVYILVGIREKQQESEIQTIVWVFELLLAGIVQSTSHNSDHTGLADFVRMTENPDYVETFSVLHFNRKLIGLSNSVRNIQKSG